MTDNQVKKMFDTWSLTPGQMVEANTSPLPLKAGSWLLKVNVAAVDLRAKDDHYTRSA